MKWLLLVILAANALVWLAGDFWIPARTNIVAENQTLPRVSTLKVDGDSGIPADDQPVEPKAPMTPLKAMSEPDTEARAEAANVPVVELDASVADGQSGDPVVPTCVRLGWFETAEAARNAYQSLGSPGAVYAVTEQERALEPLHWVIIPPQPEDRALSLFRDLQQRGIDSYLVTQGENRNAISLGLFQSEDAAKRVLAAKKRQNLNAVLANFPRNQLSYALVFEVPPADGEDAGDGLVRDYPGDFEMVEISRCEGIATTPENP
ncbi:hypothetical protein [Marinobacter confluentis]|uniref:SPOR domain-containing protein n=1 Tax=Marinobacter confluentis TaxID=1697557 RepID=A0A4Z1C7D1_9GAMM|nr:hypothetical protein [Marinobacter confluentis]TGN38595.1 hypothetical protein E5Q11_15670 [Marinobacter confluentis]